MLCFKWRMHTRAVIHCPSERKREMNTLNGFTHHFKNVEIKQIEAPDNKNSDGSFGNGLER